MTNSPQPSQTPDPDWVSEIASRDVDSALMLWYDAREDLIRLQVECSRAQRRVKAVAPIAVAKLHEANGTSSRDVGEYSFRVHADLLGIACRQRGRT